VTGLGASKTDYWDALAHQFQYQQPPLRPCAEDIGIMRKIVGEWNPRHGRPQIKVLLFGVTPEIVNLGWPSGTHLLAVEKSQAMIDVVWPGEIQGQRKAIRGNWFNLDIEDHSFDFVIGDGFLTSLAYPDQYLQMARSIFRWLKPDGLMIARLFASPEKKETLQNILADLKANRISKFDILKWRLAMAIQKNIHQGVAVGDIYRAWMNIGKEIPFFPANTGWRPETMNTIKLYEGRTNAYTFPTVAELNAVFSSAFEPVSTTFPQYDFGHCCPILARRPRIS
jgi:SAM-dependent methyltransferase